MNLNTFKFSYSFCFYYAVNFTLIWFQFIKAKSIILEKNWKRLSFDYVLVKNTVVWNFYKNMLYIQDNVSLQRDKYTAREGFNIVTLKYKTRKRVESKDQLIHEKF
jgi:hypothetical protein